MDSLISDVIVAKSDTGKMSVKGKSILARLEEYVRDLQALINAKVERKLTITDSMTSLNELESCRSIKKFDYSGKILKLTRNVQQVADLVD